MNETLDSSQDRPDPDVTTDHSTAVGLLNAGTLPSIPGYLLHGEIARGGMGRVLAGREIGLDREVAIKLLLPGASAERFIVESRITAKLPHPGIPPVYALGMVSENSPYLAMKLVRGVTLAEAMKAHPGEWSRLVPHFEPIALAVGFAHSQGITHRDIKPSNIMLGEFGEVLVMDWGLALDRNEPADAAGVVGTPAYMAPEQARGEAADPRSDVFALGGVLAAMLTGHGVFSGDSVLETVQRAANGDLSECHSRLDACGADAELIAIAKRCLSSERADRPADGRAVAELVAAYRAGLEARLRQAESDRAAAAAREQERKKRGRVIGAAVGLIAASLLVGTGISLWQMFRARDAEGVATQKAIDESDAREKADAARAAESEAKEAAIRDKRVAENTRLFFMKVLTRSSNLNIDGGTSNPNVSVKEAVDYAQTLLAKDFKDDPEGEGDIRAALGVIFLSYGEIEKSREQLQAAKKLYSRAYGENSTKGAFLDFVDGGAASFHTREVGDLQSALAALQREALKPGENQAITDINATIAETMIAFQTGQADKAERGLREASRRLEERYGADSPVPAMIRIPLAVCLMQQNRLPEGRAMLLELRGRSGKLFGEPSMCGMICDTYLAALEFSQPDGDRGEKRCRDAIAAADALRLDSMPIVIPPCIQMIHILKARNDSKGAFEFVLRAEKCLKALPSPDKRVSKDVLAYRAVLLMQLNRFAEAETAWTQIDTIRDQHPDLKRSSKDIDHGLARSRVLSGKHAEAEPVCLRYVAACEADGSDIYTGFAYAIHLRNGLGLDDKSIVESELKRITELCQKLKQADRNRLLDDLRQIGVAAVKAKQHEFAVSIHRETHRMRKQYLTVNHNDTAVSAGDYAHALGVLDKDTKLREKLYREALDGTKAAMGAAHNHTRLCADNLVAFYRKEKKFAEASAVLLELYEWTAAEKGATDPLSKSRASHAIATCIEMSRYSDAIPLLRKRLAASPPNNAENIQEHTNARLTLGECLLGAGQYEEAAKLLRESLESARTKYEKTTAFGVNEVWLADALIGLKRYAEAEPLLLDAYPKLTNPKSPPPKRTPPERAVNLLVTLYGHLNKPQEAAKWLAVRAKSTPAATAGTVDSLPALVEASIADPTDTILTIRIAVLEAWFDRVKELNVTRERALKHAAGTTDVATAERTAKICFLGPPATPEQMKSALALARQAAEAGKDQPLRHYYWMALGMGEYRAGDHAAAEATLKKAGFDEPVNEHVHLPSAFYRAMALFRLGKKDEAKRMAEDAVKKMRPLPSDPARPFADGFNPDDIAVFLAYKEAKDLIGFTATPAKK